MEDNFSINQGVGGWFRDDSSILYLLCTLFLLLLHKLHLRSSGIRSQILEIPDPEDFLFTLWLPESINSSLPRCGFCQPQLEEFWVKHSLLFFLRANLSFESLWLNPVEVMEFQLSCSKSWTMMLWKCCTQYASTFGKLTSGRRTGKGQFSFQSQRKAMPKNAQTTAQLHSSHLLLK